jgi:hypothetical protein
VDLSVLILPKLDLERLSIVLDGFGHEGRLHAVRQWNAVILTKLYDALTGFRATTLEDLVPAGTAARTAVITHGTNSLPAFSHFQKRFCRPESGDAGADASAVLYGYNEQTFRAFTGPGYFVARAEPTPGGSEVAFDYRTLPPADPAKLPPDWPPVVPNSARLGIFVYANMADRVRALSANVLVGRAFRRDRPMNTWFALVRE